MYNGWTNKETWQVNLHITNEEESYLEAKSKASAEELQEWFEATAYELIDSLPNVLWSLVNVALNKVNWQEIYEGLQE